MILIVGSSRDDVLYFQNIIKNPTEEKILNKYTLTTGTIFNQNVGILTDVYTSYVSSCLISYLIDTKMITLVVMVGKCRTTGEKIKCGDIAISKAFVTLDVDQVPVENVQLGQIPGPIEKKIGESNPESYPVVHNLSMEVINVMNQCFDSVTNAKVYGCTFMSSNIIFSSKEQLASYLNDESVLGIQDNIIFESETGGAAIACSLFNIPLISVKVVEGVVGEKINLDNYVKVLKTYSIVGKAITSFIGEIGRNDVLPTPGGNL